MARIFAVLSFGVLAACGGGGDPAMPTSAEAVAPVPIPGIPGMAPPGIPVGYDTVERTGVYSGVPAERLVVVKDAASWAALWTEYTANVMPQPAIPAVDFNTRMVIGVFLGARPDGCYSVSITQVLQDSTDLSIEYSEVRSQGACIQVITYPSHIISLPATSGAVQFIRI
jgi:hypothetical protein